MAPPPRLRISGYAIFACEEGGAQVDIDLVVPVLDRLIHHGSVAHDAGIIVQHIDAAKLGDSFHHHLLDVRFVRDVAFDEERATALVGDQLSRFFAGRSVDIGDGHGRAFIGKRQCGSAPDPFAPAGYNGYFAFKSFGHILHLIIFTVVA